MVVKENRISFEQLRDFLVSRIKMSHVYQPLLIQTLVDSGNQTTIRQVAMAFAGIDEAQILLYEDRVKKMPLPVLKKHQIKSSDGELISLNTGRLTYEERAEIKAICEQKISEFIQSRGLNTYGLSILDFNNVPEAIRYDVLVRDGRKCLLCGRTPKDGIRLEVDHILPRSKGGSNSMDNLQTLCAPCNRGKSSRDDTDFREPVHDERK